MTSCWLDLVLRRAVWKGLASFLFYGRQETKSLRKRLRFAKTWSNTSSFNCCRDSAGSALRGNRLYVPFHTPRTAGKSEFLGVTGFCRICIPNYSLLDKPLYEATKREPLVWEEDQEKAFREIKRALTNAPALGLPDVMKPFFLYDHK
jgi:hypothetical protein